jgi:hypothetical protein
MRIVTPVTIFVLVALGLVAHLPLEQIRSAAASGEWSALVREPDDAAVALAVRCGELDAGKRRICEEALAARFSSGEATPDAVLRLHCTRVGNVWEASLPEPPALCAERFGGWLSS